MAALHAAPLTADSEDLLARVETFAREEVAPRAAGWSMGETPEPAIFDAAAALGLLRIETPVADGGLGLPFAVKARAAEILAGADFGFAMSVVNTQNVALKLAEIGTPELKARWLPLLMDGRAQACTALTEPGAGSDFAAVATRARETPEGWRLDGEKAWIINGRRASLAMLYAQCGEAGDRDGVAGFAVDLTLPSCERRAMDSPFAQTSIGTGRFTLRDHPAEARLLAPGAAFRAIMGEINGARVYVAAMCNGMTAAAIEAAAAYGAERMSFGRPLAGHQAWRMKLAEASVDLSAARALVREAVAALDEGGPAAQRLSAEAKIQATNVALRRLPELMHAVGAAGLEPHRPFARHLAAAQSASLTDGSTEMLLERVARLPRPSA